MAVRFAKKSLWSLTLAGATVATSLYVLAPSPARAGDDGEGDIFATLLGAVIGVKSTPDGAINYRERAPLVVPPTMDLPPPQNDAAVTNPAWPKDADVVANEKTLARARAYDRALDDGSDYNAVLSPSQLAAHSAPIAAQDDSAPDPMCNNPISGCSPAQLWGMLSVESKKADTAALVPGVDPGRQYLTDPPAGYRVATKLVKVTTPAPPKEDDSADPAAYYRDQAARARSIDGTDSQ